MSSESESPRHTDFLPHEGAPFRVDGWSETLRLASVTAHAPPGWPPHLRQPFALIFHGPRQPVLPEGMHHIEAEDGRRFALHIMPIHTVERDRQEYQAVFN